MTIRSILKSIVRFFVVWFLDALTLLLTIRIIPAFSYIQTRENDLDVALLPVWGWGPHLSPGHMNPRRATETLTLLRPRIAIPIHWGTFYPRWLGWFRAHHMVDPPQLFIKEAAKITPNVEIHVLIPGDSLSIP
jgi:L-ascorbate metabolism protein UlaG (beta-lactamase superfamily)